MCIRPAAMADVPVLHELITHHAERGRMLFRSHGELYEHLRDFLVAHDDDRVVGCCAVELVWRDLAEIKSLAVDESRRGTGIGKRLVSAAVEEGRRLGLQRLFALTREVPFFERLGFHIVAKETLPHKVWTDCVKCPVQDCCDETAVVLDLLSEVDAEHDVAVAAQPLSHVSEPIRADEDVSADATA